MEYIATNIDTEKFLKGINEMIKRDMYDSIREKSEIAKYHEGYTKALYEVQQMFQCSNYEKREKKEE